MSNPAILIAVVALAGCARATTMPLSQDTVQITSRAAPVCGPEGAQKVAIKQASVETIKRGYDRFLIMDAAARSDVGVVGQPRRLPPTCMLSRRRSIASGPLC